MANAIYDDLAGVYTGEDEPASVDLSNAAAALAEQMRQEEEALAAVLPTQSSEAEMARRDWIERGRPTITAPVQMGAGQVMPTSRGFMYVGEALPPPEAGTPLAAQRSYESAVMRQNVPEAGAAFDQLAAMGLQPPSRFTGTMQAMPPMSTPGQQREEVLNRFARGMGAGLTPPEARAASGYDLLAQTGRYGGPMTEYQRTATALREREIANREAAATARQATTLEKPAISGRLNELGKLNDDILKTEADIAANPSPSGMPDSRSEVLGMWKARKRQLESELAAQKPTSGTATAAPSRGKLTKAQAGEFLKAARGDKAEARRMAIAAGYDTSR